MNLLEIFARYPDHEACIEHLEKVRWGDNPHCPNCGGVYVARKSDGYRVGRWNCHSCKSSFNVLQGTIFQKTKIPLQKWFLAIGIILNAKKGVSSWQLSRDLDMNQKSAWYMGMRIRAAMGDQGDLLTGIVEADECYIGGKPRKRNNHDDNTPNNKRGRGTNKMSVIGVVERGGRVVARPSHKKELTKRGLMKFIMNNVDIESALLITDEYRGYKGMNEVMRHATIHHAKRYADGLTHTNTIEGFWSLVKRAWFGTHHHYSSKYARLYVLEACYKYNNREKKGGFKSFISSVLA